MSKTVLNVGSGSSSVADFTNVFDGWKELRLDLYEESADIKADIVTLDGVEDQSMDAVWACHVIEHLDWGKLPIVFGNIMRVLKTDGAAVIRVPNLAAIADRLKGNLLEPVYYSPSGLPITALDMLYGHRMYQSSRETNLGQLHKTGFNPLQMSTLLKELNINAVVADRGLDVYAILYKEAQPTELMSRL